MKTYTDSHEWIETKGTIARIGLSKSLVDEIGTIVSSELPQVGRDLLKGDQACVLESTKAAIETYAQVTGKVIQVNSALKKNLSLLNEDPEGKGWLYKTTAAVFSMSVLPMRSLQMKGSSCSP